MSLIERLEGRRLMSVSISTSPDGSVLTVSNAANVSVTEFDVGTLKQVSILDNSDPANPSSAVVFGNFQSLHIIGTNGDDQILLNTFDLNSVIDGGNGNDDITAFIGSTSTTAGTATVMISGDNGADSITVDGSINSPFTVQEQGIFIVNGGNGDDSITIADGVKTVVVPSRGSDSVALM